MRFFLISLFVLLSFVAQASAETSYERVMRTGVLRCGYIPYAPAVIIDPNTKRFSGLIPEVMAEAGRLLDLKIEWTEELGFGTTVDALKGGRVDAICIGFWENPAEGRHVFFSRPMYYSPVYPYVRANDHRFDKDVGLPMDDIRLKSMVDAALSQIVNSGHMDKVITKYEKYPGSLLRVAKPYEAPK